MWWIALLAAATESVSLFRSAVSNKYIGEVTVAGKLLWVQMEFYESMGSSRFFVDKACPSFLACLASVCMTDMFSSMRPHRLAIQLTARGHPVVRSASLCDDADCLTAGDVAGILAWNSRDGGSFRLEAKDGHLDMIHKTVDDESDASCFDLTMGWAFRATVSGIPNVLVWFDPNVLGNQVSLALQDMPIMLRVGDRDLTLAGGTTVSEDLPGATIVVGSGLLNAVKAVHLDGANGKLCLELCATCDNSRTVDVLRETVPRYARPTYTFDANDDLTISMAASDTGPLILRRQFSADWLLFYDLEATGIKSEAIGDGYFAHPGCELRTARAPSVTRELISIKLRRVASTAEKAVSVKVARFGQYLEISFTLDMFHLEPPPPRSIQHNAECAICIKKLEGDGNEINTLTCTHEYHSNCIRTWFKTSLSCPICRQKQKSNSVSRLIMGTNT